MRNVRDFHGGVHPPENKVQSLCGPIRPAGIPPQLVIPLSQSYGGVAVALVEPGQQIAKGEQIARAEGLSGVPEHAPSSGRVAAIEERSIAHPSGLPATCIVLDTDGRDEWIEHHGAEDFRQLELATLLDLIRNAGISGMGGAGFPAAVKLSVNPANRIKTLIINGTECEPYITADEALMRECAMEIIGGAEILGHLLGANETLIGVEDNKPQGIAALRQAAQGSAIEIVSFPAKYPSGGERQLIEILTGKQVPSNGLPADIQVVCQNIGTALAVYRAVNRGEPLLSRVTTVTGEAVSRPGNYEVLNGTPIDWLLQQAGFRQEHCSRLIMGGPMMGFTVTDVAAPITKTSTCLLASTESELPAPPPAQSCIRCGFCSQACPVMLLPQQLYWFARGKEYEKLEDHHLFDCIECGACSYVCPSNIPLVQYYRAGKAQILELRDEHERAERSRIRFEARQERIEKIALARQEKRVQRKAAAQQRAREAGGDGSEQDLIQAAIARSRARQKEQTRQD